MGVVRVQVYCAKRKGVVRVRVWVYCAKWTGVVRDRRSQDSEEPRQKVYGHCTGTGMDVPCRQKVQTL